MNNYILFVIFSKQILSLIRYVFIHGPSWLGSYEGLSENDICSSLTKVDAVHWASMEAACKSLIDRKVRAGLVGLGAVSSLMLLWTSMQACANITLAKVYSKLV